MAVVVATAETSSGPWSYLPAKLSKDRLSASFTTTHFSIATLFGDFIGATFGEFKKLFVQFINGLDSGATTTVTKPSCSGEDVARSNGYSIASSTTDAVHWCFGMSGTNRVLKVVDDRRYPMEVLHPNLSVSQGGSIDWAQLSSLSHFGSGQNTIIAPGDQVTYQVNVPTPGQGGIQTQMDGLGQSLYALQVGLRTMVQILTKFGVGSGSSEIDTFGKVLRIQSCADAIGKGPGALVSGCFSPKDILEAFGTAGLLLAPIVAVGGLLAFFHSEWNALVDQFNGHDKYTVAITRTAQTQQPTLGVAFHSEATGFGSVEPTSVHYGGDGYSFADHLVWQGWGASSATGTGTGWYVPGTESRDQGMNAPITVVAFALGSCGGVPAYTKFSWYFPKNGENLDASYYLDACTGQLVLPPVNQAPPVSTPISCDVQALATAAAAFEQANGDPDGSGSIIHSEVCIDGYAAASFTPGNVPETGATLAFKQQGSGWIMIGEGNILPANLGIPSDVYMQLENTLVSAPQTQTATF